MSSKRAQEALERVLKRIREQVKFETMATGVIEETVLQILWEEYEREGGDPNML